MVSRRTVTWFAIAALGVGGAVAGFLGLHRASDELATRLSHDLGLITGAGSIEHTYSILNGSSAGWNLEGITRSCGCLGARAESSTIAPGQSLRVTVSLDVRGTPGQHTHNVICRFKERPILVLEFRYSTQPKLQAIPATLNLGRIARTRTVTGVVRIDLAEGLSLGEVTTVPAGMFSVSTSAKPGHGIVNVTYVASDVARFLFPITAELRVAVSNGDQVRVQILGEVVQPVLLVPAAVLLRREPTLGGEFVWLSRLDPSDPTAILSVSVASAPGIEVRRVPREEVDDEFVYEIRAVTATAGICLFSVGMSDGRNLELPLACTTP